MAEHAHELGALLWAAGWLLAVIVLFVAGLRLPLETRLGGVSAWLYAAACVVAGLGVWVLANVALVLNDTHIDLTREKVYTPSADAMAVVDELRSPVSITYFYRSEDPVGRRAGEILEVMGRRNPLLTVLTVDPDKQPELARREGIRLYNAAIVEAAGRRVLIQGTDEAEIAIGIQRVLRKRALTVCFLEGHGEFSMDGFEFHTHIEGVSDHSHGEASSHVIETAGQWLHEDRKQIAQMLGLPEEQVVVRYAAIGGAFGGRGLGSGRRHDGERRCRDGNPLGRRHRGGSRRRVDRRRRNQSRHVNDDGRRHGRGRRP